MNVIVPKTKVIGGMTVPIEMPEHQAYWILTRFGNIPRYWLRTIGEKKTARELGFMPPGEAIIRTSELIFDRTDFEIQDWSAKMLHDLAENTGSVNIIGPASCGKSECTAIWILYMWGLTPSTTTIFLVSTTVPQLRRRSFGAVAKYHHLLKKIGYPGIYSRQFTMIVQEDELKDGVASTDIKSGIIGIAAEGGKGEMEAAGRMGGVHQSTPAGAPNEAEGMIACVIDEAMAIPNGIYKAAVNLRSGCDFFANVNLGNLMRTTGDCLSDWCEPVGGWSSIDLDSERWECTRRNVTTLRLDGIKSPAVIHGEDKYPYLIGPRHIQDILDSVKGNELDPFYLSMVRTWPSDANATDVVFSSASQSKYRVREKAEWLNGTPEAMFAGIDPSWTATGDNAVMVLAKAGMMTDGIYGIELQPPIYLKLVAESEVPTQYQLSNQILAVMMEHRIPLKHVAVDESASQLLADCLLMESGQKDPIRANFAGRATENQVSVFTEQTCRQRYANLVTEIWFRVENFASFGHIRGLSGPAAHQFATRQIVPDKRPVRLEKKSDYKARLRSGSPDEGDAAALAVFAATEVLRLTPGATIHHRHGRTNHNPVTTTADYEETNYSNEEDYS